MDDEASTPFHQSAVFNLSTGGQIAYACVSLRGGNVPASPQKEASLEPFRLRVVEDASVGEAGAAPEALLHVC